MHMCMHMYMCMLHAHAHAHVHTFSIRAVFHQLIPFTASTLVVVVKGHRLLSIPHMLNQE